jgi:predicted ester cyclase
VGTFLGIAPTGRPFHFTLVFLLDFAKARSSTTDASRLHRFLVQLGAQSAA